MMLGDESYAANPAADSVVFFWISSPLQPAQPCPITMYEPARTMVRHEPTGNGSSGLAVFRLGPTRLRQRRMLQVNMFILQREPACLGSRFIIQGRPQLCLPKTYPWKLPLKPATFKKSKPSLCRRVDRQVTMLHSVQDRRMEFREPPLMGRASRMVGSSLPSYGPERNLYERLSASLTSQAEKRQHLNARVKLSLALTLGKEKRYNHQLSRALASKGAKRGQEGLSPVCSRWVKHLWRIPRPAHRQ
jgi:hypothetical protein